MGKSPPSTPSFKLFSCTSYFAYRGPGVSTLSSHYFLGTWPCRRSRRGAGPNAHGRLQYRLLQLLFYRKQVSLYIDRRSRGGSKGTSSLAMEGCR